MVKYENKIKLRDNSSVDEVSEQITEFLTAEKIDRKYVLRIKLSIEEVLLRWRDNHETGECKIILNKKRGSIDLALTMHGICCDPFDGKTDDALDSENLGRNMMANLGVDFKFYYWRGSNCVSLTIKRKRNTLLEMAAAISAAAVLGVLLKNISPQTGQIVNDYVLVPLFDSFLGFLGAAIGPFMFLAVVCGLTSVGNAAALGKIGKVLFTRYLCMGVLASVVTGFVMLPFIECTSTAGTAENTGQFADLVRLVLDIVPSNFVDAFLSGNALQIIFIAMVMGVSLVALRPASNGLISIIEILNEVFGVILKFITGLLPLFIFVNILKLILSDTIHMFGRVWWIYTMLFAVITVLTIIQVFTILLREKVSPVIVLRKIAPTFLLSLVTASSTSSFQTNLECCEKELGIDEKLVKIGVPLGMVLYKPASNINLCILAVFFAELYGVPLTIPIFLMILLFSFVLSVAVPPVAGGAIACYTLLFAQFGIPLEALMLAATLEVISDFILTAFNIAFLQMEVLHSSRDMQLLNTTVLKSVNSDASMNK